MRKIDSGCIPMLYYQHNKIAHEGVVCADCRVSSQHTDHDGLACLKKRDSCIAQAIHRSFALYWLKYNLTGLYGSLFLLNKRFGTEEVK
ncbi:MAG TPA: hypothetical protein DDX68_01105 [Clostridium sp.]|nr:hypothetical protein [Clostridium sp.]